MVAQRTKQNNAAFARGGMTLLGRQIAADSPGINRLAGDLILRAVARGIDQIADISIHSPRARGDGCGCSGGNTATAFQSTPLVRGETIGEREPEKPPDSISIHSPRARGDPMA